MEYFTVIVAIGFLVWGLVGLVKWIGGYHLRKMEDQKYAYHESIKKGKKARGSVSDSDKLKRMRDKYND